MGLTKKRTLPTEPQPQIVVVRRGTSYDAALKKVFNMAIWHILANSEDFKTKRSLTFTVEVSYRNG